ncbi:MAG: M1 family metallopeptidase [Bacteroidota bacterium]
MRKFLLSCYCCCLVLLSFGQRDFYQKGNYAFTQQDTLRGMLSPVRSCYDVTFYQLDITIDVENKSLDGFVDIQFTAVEDFERLQVDLYENMNLSKITFEGKRLDFERLGNAVFVDFPKQQKGAQGTFRIYYNGQPTVARNAPWDGGFVWSKDSDGAPWIGVACEGDGASLWWPNKDHLSDEPDSMAINVAVPRGLTCVANGNLRGVSEKGGYDRFEWFVSYPINNYNVTVNIANYAHWTETYTAFDGSTMPMDYYVLQANEEKAKEHFKQTVGVLECYEYVFDKYPFWNDGFAMVETPYLGMEHQGAIAYGNKYKRGYLGGMIPKNMDWDYIIVHETGHEYFGNSISCNDLSEMWIHESFTTYMEALYVECQYDFDEAKNYLRSQRYMIANREPILGPKEVNWENWKSSDHYYKGAWVLHTLRGAIGDDELFFEIMKGFYRENAISNVNTEDFITYVNAKTGKDFQPFFEQYLWYPSIPIFEYDIEEAEDGVKIHYRWNADVSTFDMPFALGAEEDMQRIHPKVGEWQVIELAVDSEELAVANDEFLVRLKRVKQP